MTFSTSQDPTLANLIPISAPNVLPLSPCHVVSAGAFRNIQSSSDACSADYDKSSNTVRSQLHNTGTANASTSEEHPPSDAPDYCCVQL